MGEPCVCVQGVFLDSFLFVFSINGPISSRKTSCSCWKLADSEPRVVWRSALKVTKEMRKSMRIHPERLWTRPTASQLQPCRRRSQQANICFCFLVEAGGHDGAPEGYVLPSFPCFSSHLLLCLTSCSTLLLLTIELCLKCRSPALWRTHKRTQTHTNRHRKAQNFRKAHSFLPVAHFSILTVFDEAHHVRVRSC